MTTLASYFLRRKIARRDAFEVRVSRKVQPHVWMAGLAGIAAYVPRAIRRGAAEKSRGDREQPESKRKGDGPKAVPKTLAASRRKITS
jgi:hypothetical protein